MAGNFATFTLITRRLPGLLAGKSNAFKTVITFSVPRTMSSAQNLDISGMFPPIPTAFDEQENVDWAKIEFNLQKWEQMPFRGYVVQGSNGEYVYMTPEERVEMVAKVRQIAPKNKMIIAGSGCESTRDTIKMSQKMADAGADAMLVVTPSYYKSGMNDDAMNNHFTAVADAIPVPLILYNCPSCTGINISIESVAKLAKHPNIIGLKDSGGEIARIGSIVHKTRDEDFQVLAGSASFLLPALNVGCVGGVCALANVLGQEVCDIITLFNQGKHEEAMKLQHRLIAPNADVTKHFGVPGLKTAMEWFGFHGGPCRSPLQPLKKEQAQKMRNDFEENGFL